MLKEAEMMTEARRSFRIKEKLPVQWQNEEKKFSGHGTIRNISTTGALLEISGGFPFASEIGSLSLTPQFHGETNFLPNKARLVWNQRKNDEAAWWGLEFIDPLEAPLASLRERIQTKIMDATKKRKFISVMGVISLFVLVGLMVFVLKEQQSTYQVIESSADLMMNAFQQQASLTRNYVELYHQSQEDLATATKDLAATKAFLEQTEALLTETKQQNATLQNQIALLKDQTNLPSAVNESPEAIQSQKDLENQIALLNEKNSQFSTEITTLKEQMQALTGDVKSLEEGRDMISLFHNRLKLVKAKMHYLKQEARYAKIAAQKERDRILLMRGNKGFLVKKGAPAQTVNGSQKSDDKNVDIDVSFIE